jgi:hypothetical protein
MQFPDVSCNFLRRNRYFSLCGMLLLLLGLNEYIPAVRSADTATMIAAYENNSSIGGQGGGGENVGNSDNNFTSATRATSAASAHQASATECPSGFWGESCDEVCPIRCENDGQCTILDDSHGNLESASSIVCVCINDQYAPPVCDHCVSGFWGDQCLEVCPKLCINGGFCSLANDDHGNLDSATEIICICPTGFDGPLCNIDLSADTDEEEGEEDADADADDGGANASNDNDGSGTSTTLPSSSSSSSTKSSLSIGGKVGIAVGAIVGLSFMILMIVRRGQKGTGFPNTATSGGGQQSSPVVDESNIGKGTSTKDYDNHNNNNSGIMIGSSNGMKESVTSPSDLLRREESFVETDAELA